MNATSSGQTITIAEPFDKALKSVRNALVDADLGIVGGFDISADLDRNHSFSRVLLVDCPFLLFEALVLDRAAAVFLPLHILLSEDGEETHVLLISPTRFFDARLPVGATYPIDRLEVRVEQALESISSQENGLRRYLWGGAR